MAGSEGKRVHWTQTPEGKRKLADRSKRLKAGARVTRPKHADLVELAKIGARVKLAEAEREVTRLRMFLGRKRAVNQ